MFIGACFDKHTALESFSAFTDPDFKFKFFLVGGKKHPVFLYWDYHNVLGRTQTQNLCKLSDFIYSDGELWYLQSVLAIHSSRVSYLQSPTREVIPNFQS